MVSTRASVKSLMTFQVPWHALEGGNNIWSEKYPFITSTGYFAGKTLAYIMSYVIHVYITISIVTQTWPNIKIMQCLIRSIVSTIEQLVASHRITKVLIATTILRSGFICLTTISILLFVLPVALPYRLRHTEDSLFLKLPLISKLGSIVFRSILFSV